MSASSFISAKLSFKSKAAMASVAVSFAVIVVAIAISSGFRYEISRSLSNTLGDISVAPLTYRGGSGDAFFCPEDSLRRALSNIGGVDSVRAVIWKSGIIKHGDDIQGVMFKGIDSGESGSMKISVPRSLADRLLLGKGDRTPAYFIGENISVRNFEIENIYESVSTADDKMVVFCNIETLRRVCRLDSCSVSALELTLWPSVRNSDRIYDVSNDVSVFLYHYAEESGIHLVSTPVRERYYQLFEWLDLIDNNVTFILLLMMTVAAFNMIASLLIILFENISAIGLLTAMGMRAKDIGITFLKSSFRLVFKGMCIGNFAALALCLIQKYTHLLALDPANYFVNHVPVHIDGELILVCDFLALAVIMLCQLLPCLFIAGVQPASSLRRD